MTDAAALPPLDRAGLERMRESFLAVFTDFGDFHDVPSLYHETERAYKDEAAGLVRTHLAPSLFAEGEAHDDPARDERVVAAALRVLTATLRSAGHPQNIVGWRYVDFLRQMTGDERAGFARAFHALLHGGGESPERAATFVAAMWPTWQRTLGGNPYAVSRVFPTFFLMLQDPRHDVAARTDLFVRAGRLVLPPSFYLLRNRPFAADDYRRLLAFAGAVRGVLHGWGWSPRDMIDIHSFLWVGSQTSAGPAATDEET